MTLGKVIVLSIIGIFAAFMIAFFLPMAHSYGAECTSYDATLSGIQAQGVAVYSVPPDKVEITAQDVEMLTGDDDGTGSRAFMFETDTVLFVGFEVGGCLLDPVYLAKPQGKSI